MIRNMIHSRIVVQYKTYCEGIASDGFAPLSDTILYNILHQCSAAVRKSLSGLDGISVDGSGAFDGLIDMCEQLVGFGKVKRETYLVT